jgi:hypothetical protein
MTLADAGKMRCLIPSHTAAPLEKRLRKLKNTFMSTIKIPQESITENGCRIDKLKRVRGQSITSAGAGVNDGSMAGMLPPLAWAEDIIGSCQAKVDGISSQHLKPILHHNRHYQTHLFKQMYQKNWIVCCR